MDVTAPPIYLTLVLDARGSGVTGAISRCSSVRHEPTELSEGHIEGDTVTFRCRSLDGDRAVSFVGRLNGDEIVFTWDLQVRDGGQTPGVFDPFAPLPGRRIQGPAWFTVKRAPDEAGAALLATVAERIRTTPARAAVTFEGILRADQQPQNWLTYSGKVLGHRYSPLAQITTANVGNLELAWIWQQAHSAGRFEATPLVVDGVLYTVQAPNDVVALEATTGRVLWTYPYEPAPAARASAAGGRINRGLAVLEDTLFMGTLDAHLLAINAKTGGLVWKMRVADATDSSCQVPNAGPTATPSRTRPSSSKTRSSSASVEATVLILGMESGASSPHST